jgi:ActR/RegA family two-component response regulator
MWRAQREEPQVSETLNRPHQPAALLLCDHGTVKPEALDRAVADAGFVVAVAVSRWVAAVEAVVETPVDVAIIDLALAGRLGVRLVSMLRTAAPAT